MGNTIDTADTDAAVGAEPEPCSATDLENQNLMAQNGRLQEYLDRIFGISSAIIYVLDASGRFIFVNRGVEEILNFTPEELIGKHFSFILPPDEYERVSREAVLPRLVGRVLGTDAAPKLFDERRRGVRRTRNMELRLMTRRADDYRMVAGGVTGVVEVEGAYSIVDDPAANNGKKEVFLGSQGVIFDITKYKQAELERLDLHKRLFHIQKMDAVGKLSGRVAHDLNNKLGSIIGTAELLKQSLKNADPEMLEANVSLILSASKHAVEMSNMLYKFSRKGESPYEALDFHRLLNNALGFAETIAGSSVSVHKVLQAKAPVITGSETILQSAILNLIINAFEAMKNGGGILTVETNDVTVNSSFRTTFNTYVPPGDYLLLSVQDTGVGMDESIKKRLFEPFFTTDAEKGLGLGLISIRECIRNHGGVINMESDLGKGSRFDIYLPYSDDL